jgi:hypothetical protein
LLFLTLPKALLINSFFDKYIFQSVKMRRVVPDAFHFSAAFGREVLEFERQRDDSEGFGI